MKTDGSAITACARFVTVGLVSVVALVACGGNASSSPGSTTTSTVTSSLTALRCGTTPGPSNTVSPIFSRPFEGAYPLTNHFDHDLPFQFQDTNGFQLNSCGERIGGGVDGHSGHDWVMPTGTRLLAVAAGEVIAAGVDPPFFCPPLGRKVADQQFVEILHEPIEDERFSSVYVHLSRIRVGVGEQVSAGQTIGRSGNTGCSTEAHLHFHVWRHTHTNSGQPAKIDPFGWEGKGDDPWATHPLGAESVWLWREGESPPLILR